jgi:hypothetical protein
MATHEVRKCNNKPAIHWTGGNYGMIEASCLGLKPGEWPVLLAIDGDLYRMLADYLDRQGFVVYKRERDGHQLNVYND